MTGVAYRPNAPSRARTEASRESDFDADQEALKVSGQDKAAETGGRASTIRCHIRDDVPYGQLHRPAVSRVASRASQPRERRGLARRWGNESMTKKTLHILMLTVAFPFLVSSIVYFGFGTNYTGRVFHESGFRSQYESGIYKYRVLGRQSLLETYRFINSKSTGARHLRRAFAHLPAGVSVLDKDADPAFYAAYFVHNTFFLVVSCVILYFIVAGTVARATVSSTVMTGALLMGVTQYVVCPYDTMSYSFLLLSYLLIIRPFRFSLLMLIFVLIASTATRESAALTLSFFFAHHYADLALLKRRELRQLSLLTGVFVVTYGLLRVFIGFDEAIFADMRLIANLSSFYSLLGIMAMPIVSYLIVTLSSNKRKCMLFLLASSPYWLSTMIIARSWEIRLWVPVWLGLICFTRGVPNKGVQATGGSPVTRA
jgi:hypothetical protein